MWLGVYHHFNPWSKRGAWKQAYCRLFGLSSVEIDVSHTSAKNGAVAVGYIGLQGRSYDQCLVGC
jgi:hypothetical protein